MPIYEYECQSCGNQFEVLILPSIPATTAICPECQGQQVERLLSGFAVSSAGISKQNLAVARKRHFSSDKYRDKKIAEQEAEFHHAYEEHGIEPPKRKIPPR